MKFLRHIRDVVGFLLLPKAQRRITFYSEGENYWPHLEGLVKEILANCDVSVCYVSSSQNDPGLSLEHPNYRTFKIDDSFIRDWFFENVDTDVMVMTMPDLHQYRIRRSKFNVHYVYVQHSLVSLHMIYRKGAFDHFDTIFCSGPHHAKEIRAMESAYNLPPKNLVEHGYARLDSIIEQHQKNKGSSPANKTRHFLIAPSWGPNSTIELGFGALIVDALLTQNQMVTLRPHPQTIKFANEKVQAIVAKHKDHALFKYESNVAGQESLQNSDIMVSDWSGAALEYAFGLNKPVIFIDVPRKVNNPDYKDIGIIPFEEAIRGKIGKVLPVSRIADIVNVSNSIEVNANPGEYCFNLSESSLKGARELIKLL